MRLLSNKLPKGKYLSCKCLSRKYLSDLDTCSQQIKSQDLWQLELNNVAI